MPIEFKQVTHAEQCCDALNHLHEVCSEASKTDPYEISIEILLENCTIEECASCSVICCPEQSPLHFHSDGCAACATRHTEAEDEPQKWRQ